jgi:hypothetical protein
MAFPWVILEVVMHDPGTHIYTYLLPGTILAAFGLRTVGEGVVKLLRRPFGGRINLILGVCLFGFLFALSHLLFVDHTTEYPWEAKRFLSWRIERPGGEYKLWTFGFPYNRRWEEIHEFVASSGYSGFYLTNEKQTIAERYVPGRYSSKKADLYIHIVHPQSFTDMVSENEKVLYWIRHNPPIKIYQNGSRVVAEVYAMPAGTIDEIHAAGY